MIYGQLLRIGPVVGTGPVVSLTYIQAYINLGLVISPSRAPPSQKFIFVTHIEGPQMRLPSLLQVHIVNYMRLLLSAYKTKLVNNMIIKSNLKNKCIVLIPAV